MKAGDRLILTVERPAAGGRMIARHPDGIVLISAAIPGETVEAQVEKVQRGTCWARTLRVLEASSDRVAVGDWACGGNVLAHVTYARQLVLKREIIEDAFRRLARLPVPQAIDVAPSDADGYRMRARLHVVNGRLGFYREGTHEWCDPATARQLLPDSIAALRRLEDALAAMDSDAVESVELAENRDASERAVHFELRRRADPSRIGSMAPVAGVRGASCGASLGRPVVVWGQPQVCDHLQVPLASGDIEFTLTRHAHAFFQGNRYLLVPLVQGVVDAVRGTRVLDLYAGVGLFSVAVAARGAHKVVAIEGDRTSADDLKRNARNHPALDARQQDVERYLAAQGAPGFDTVIVDPPRTGMSKSAMLGVVARRPARLVYVSCDVATLARDARLLVDHGYRLVSIRAFDLFPNTAHVESLVVFDADGALGQG